MTSARQILSFALDGLLAHLGSLSPRPGGPTSLDAPPSLGPRRNLKPPPFLAAGGRF
jgi:hypothetical protein